MQSQLDILKITAQDIEEDKDFLSYLVRQSQQKINYTKNLLAKQLKFHPSVEINILKQELDQLESTGVDLHNQIQAVNSKPETQKLCMQSSQEIQNLIYSLRGYLRLVASVRCLLEWQSPSFAGGTPLVQQGLLKEPIKHAYNDYKRDQHEIGCEYERKFATHYLPRNILFPYRAYLTSSGMSALTTIVGFLKAQHGKQIRVLIGKSVYFEERIVLKTFFPDGIFFDEDDLDSLAKIIAINRPHAIFIDTLSNTHEPKIFSVSEINSTIDKSSVNPIHLVVDNTLTPNKTINHHKFSLVQNKVHVVYWESLIKYHQYGLDLGYAGIIYSNAPGTGALYTYRDHLGTNCSDQTAAMLPTPNQHILTKRLKRHTRNLNSLKNLINESFSDGATSIQMVTAKKQSTKEMQTELYFNSVGVIQFSENYKSSRMQKLLKNIISLAKKRQVNILAGTSFGFQTTRVYIPACRPGQGVPFFRVAVGCETLLECQTIGKLVVDAIVAI